MIQQRCLARINERGAKFVLVCDLSSNTHQKQTLNKQYIRYLSDGYSAGTIVTRVELEVLRMTTMQVRLGRGELERR